MQHITMDDVRQLAEFEGSPCVSIFLPTQRRGGRSIKQDAQRLRHALDRAHERAVVLSGRDSKELMDFFNQSMELVSEDSFWQDRSDGLALFLAPNFEQIYHLPEEFIESVSVDRHFNVTPLLDLAKSHAVLVLAISQNHVQLWQVDNQLTEPLEVAGMPASLAEVQRFKETEKLENRHVAGGPGSYHGEGDDSRMARVELGEFVQAVDKALIAGLKNKRLPLVLLGAEPTVGTFRQQSRYPEIVPEVIRCNPEVVKPQQICQEAQPILLQLESEEVDQAKSIYANFKVTEPARVSDSPTDILKAAREGRIESMLVASGSAGLRPSEGFNEYVADDGILSDVNDDLVNAAVRETLLKGGEVYSLHQDDFPTSFVAAAIMRY